MSVQNPPVRLTRSRTLVRFLVDRVVRLRDGHAVTARDVSPASGAVDAGAIMVESQLVRAISPKQCLYTLASKPSHSKQGRRSDSARGAGGVAGVDGLGGRARLNPQQRS